MWFRSSVSGVKVGYKVMRALAPRLVDEKRVVTDTLLLLATTSIALGVVLLKLSLVSSPLYRKGREIEVQDSRAP